MSMLIPYLNIVKQTALSEEKVTKRGKTAAVFVVVKNSPFQLSVSLLNANGTNFNHLAFDIALIYDMPGVVKEVSYVSTKPVDYKPSLNDTGDEICFDVKIKVLSSHHEDNFFKLRVTVWDANNENFPSLSLLSHPIKVISKPMNQRKTRKRATSTAPRGARSKNVTPPSSPGPAPINNIVQNSTPSNLEFTLEKLCGQQEESLRMLQKLLDAPNCEERATKRMKLSHESEMDPHIAMNNHDCNPSDMGLTDFETCFSIMLRIYGSMSAEEKAERIRKLVRSMSSRDVEQMEEIVDIMQTAGLKTTMQVPDTSYHHNAPIINFMVPDGEDDWANNFININNIVQ